MRDLLLRSNQVHIVNGGKGAKNGERRRKRAVSERMMENGHV
jgi:hypothetical protein